MTQTNSWSATFEFKGKHLPYNRVQYNNPPSERTVEVPISLDFLANLEESTSILEIGNVLSNYKEIFTDRHERIHLRRIVDKFEKAVGIDNQDLMDLPSTEKYNRIISISTIEHIGQGIEPSKTYGEQIETRDVELPLKAIVKIYDLLANEGKALITVPFGKFTDFDWFIQFGKDYLELLFKKYGLPKNSIVVTCLKQIAKETTSDYPHVSWVELDMDLMNDVEFGRPFYAANGIAVIEIVKIPNEVPLKKNEINTTRNTEAEQYNTLQAFQKELTLSKSFLNSVQKELSQPNTSLFESPQKILFYYAGLTNSSQAFAGSSSAVVTLAIELAKTELFSIHITGDHVRYNETYKGVLFLPLPDAENRSTLLNTYDVIVFATHLQAFFNTVKPANQIWILHQHCWAVGPIELNRINDFNVILCLSKIHQEAVINQSIPSKKVKILPNIVDINTFRPQPVERNPYSIMFAGAIVKHKGVHVLLEALEGVRHIFPNAEVHIYGSAAMWHDSDSYEQEMRTLNMTGVHFYGVVPSCEMPNVYSQHSILCLPSELESFGLVLVEAQACGCIPIVHNVGGVAATIKENETGFFYYPNTSQELAKTIIKVFARLDADFSIRQRATFFVADSFNPQKLVTEFIRILNIAVENHQNILKFDESHQINSNLTESIENSAINQLIPPEVKNDAFYEAIQRLAKTEEIKTVLEIGSSSGEGSTEAFVNGLRQNPHRPLLYCMEVSKARFTALKERYAHDPFVKGYNVSSVPVAMFPNEETVMEFYNTTPTILNNYPLEQVLGWLREDIRYVKNSGVPENGIRIIKEENNIQCFDAVLIDGSEFTGVSELEEVYGATFIALDDTNAFKNYHNRQRLLADPNYKLIEENLSVRNGYAIFKKVSPQPIQENFKLPIHFFTIVLNGIPFIHYHTEVFKQLPFAWHWHIVEGVADLKHDTAWSIELGGYITDELHRNGRSNDGTSEYIDELKRQYPQNITIYRKPVGIFWDGKREMVNAPLVNIHEECLLWQVDVDELWTLQQICTARQMFINNPDKTAAWYWCWYFVGENLVISTRNCYAQNPQQEWLRTWRFKPGMAWEAHEPPRLAEPLLNDQWRNVAAVNPFLHNETEKQGLVFQHFAYVTMKQLQFKEKYYGYKNAVSQWLGLQAQTLFPILLRQHLAWVHDETIVNTAESCGIVPIARKQIDGTTWQFRQSDNLPIQILETKKNSIKVIVDGVFFQLNNTGIARVWKSLLEEWVANGFANNILVIDRAGTAPKIPGLRYRTVPAYDYSTTDSDRRMLQQVCDEVGTELFISTYYTTPLSTPSVFMVYDMIPELVGMDLDNPQWREKHCGIRHASAYIAISENTARNLVGCFPDISPDSITVAHCGVKNTFSQAKSEEVVGFKFNYGIFKPYFILVGERVGWQNCKNAVLFFKAFYQLPNRAEFDIVCVGGSSVLEPEFVEYTSGCTVHLLRLSDDELKTAYSGAVGLVYPSLYEGFGMPVLEAIACACPVITCPYGSIPEVAGKAALYVSASDVNELLNALINIQKPEVRNTLIATGLEQAKKFSWSKMAAKVSSALLKLVDSLSLEQSPAPVEVVNEYAQQYEFTISALDSAHTRPESLSVSTDSNNVQPINEAFLSKEREFWNVDSMYEAMFSRVFADETINQMSLQVKIESWNLSALDSAQQIIRDIPTKPEWTILEIGCGVGRVIKPLREMFAQVDGVDIAENMIQFAKEYLADGKQNGQVYLNNGSDLQELLNENYDFVYSMIVFQHIRSISVVKNYFREIFRVLKPSGYFKIQVNDYQDNPAAGKFDEEADAETQYAFAGNGYTDDQLRGLLAEQGFDVVSIDWQSPWIWATVQRPEQQITSLNDFVAKSQPTKVVFKVSAIVSTYNSENLMRGCLQDLVEQTLYQKGEVEILVIDSNSEQNEQAIVREFQAKYPNIVYHRTQARETLYASWNRAIKLSRGIYITNANTDDRHRPDALEVMARYLDTHPITSLVYASQLISTAINDTWATTQANQYLKWPPFDYKELERQCICGPQPMWRKSLHEKYGYFRSEFVAAGDYEFWLRSGKTENFVRLPEIMGIYYHNPQGLSTSGTAPIEEPSRIWEEYGIHREGVVPANVTATISLWELNALPYRTSQVLVSVIIPTKDRPEMLAEAVQSVLNQTYSYVEIIVVNDGGIDVQEVLNLLNAKGNIVYLKHSQNLDRSAARNTGIRAARGKYIAYLDDDDIYYPNHIETLVKFLENSEYQIAYTDAVMAQQEKQNGEYVTLHRSVPYSLDFDKDKILVSNCTPNLCLMHEKSCLDEVGLFDETLSTHEDWDLVIRFSRKFNIAHIKETTCEFTQRNDGTNTSSHNRADFTRTREIIFNKYRQYAEANPAILEAQKEAFIAEAKELAQQVQNTQAEFTQSLSQAQSQLQEKESQLQQTQAEKSHLAAQVETWQRTTHEVQAKLEATQSEKEWVKSQLNTWKQTAEQMQMDLERSRLKLKQAQSEVERSALNMIK